MFKLKPRAYSDFAGEQRAWKCEAQCRCGIEIDRKFECSRLLHRQVGWLGTFEKLVHIGCGPPVQLTRVGPTTLARQQG